MMSSAFDDLGSIGGSSHAGTGVEDARIAEKIMEMRIC